LKELEEWRELLAADIAKRNHDLNAATLTDAVQRMIDRILFLRFAEDRGIEQYGVLKTLHKEKGIYAKLFDIFQTADRRYNSGLFHFRKERGRGGEIDTTAGALQVGDDPLKQIISRLYYPDSPYAFSVIPADILGQVYEQFLGKVITLGARHSVKVEEKPEVRKAGGVFYTPTWVVREIVRRTIGRTFEGSTADKMEEFRALDPACGSGSFLLGAFDALLTWHRDYYAANQPKKWEKAGRLVQADGNYRLALAEKKRVLRMLYGVDIDRQAVEVTKLSLLLKLLEEENAETLQGFGVVDRILPDLDDRIVCGNSLIGYNVIDDDYLALASEDQQRINPFDWEGTFPFLKNGGFDCVIGNPPYIRIQAMKEWAPYEVEYYKRAYRAAGKGNYDIYVVFIEQALQLLNKNGTLGFILPHKFFNAQYGEPIRQLIAEGKHLREIVHFGDGQIFKGATTYTCLLFLDKAEQEEFSFHKVNYAELWCESHSQGAATGYLQTATVNSQEWNFVVGDNAALYQRLSSFTFKLGDVTDIFVGLQTSADDVFILSLISEQGKHLTLHSVAQGTSVTLERNLLHPVVSGEDVNRYLPLPERQFIIFPYEIDDSKSAIISFDQIKKITPLTAAYLEKNRKRLSDRENEKMRNDKWYGYIYLKNMNRQSNIKLCVPRLVNRLYAGYDYDGSHFLDNVDVGGVTLREGFKQHDLRYILGLLNSQLLRWYFPFVSAPFRGGFMSANRQFLSQLPIRTIDFSNPEDIRQHDQMVALVERTLTLHKKQAEATTAHEKTNLTRQIEATDQQIDKLVYELYKLTEEEIRIVEGR